MTPLDAMWDRTPFRWIDAVGRRVIQWMKYPLQLVGLLYVSVKVVWTDRDLGQRAALRQVLDQIYFTGVQATPTIAVLAIGLGVGSMVWGVAGVGAISGAESLGRMLTVVVLRDIAPLLTGTVVIARSVTAVAAELGNMKVQREIEAVEVVGLSPVRYLVTPRLLGGVFAFFGLNVIFDAIALAAGLVVGRLLFDIPAELLLRAVLSAMEPEHAYAFSLKIGVGGFGIFLIACHHGMAVRRASTEVPVAVSKAALNALLFMVALHAVVSAGSLLQNATTAPILRGVL